MECHPPRKIIKLHDKLHTIYRRGRRTIVSECRDEHLWTQVSAKFEHRMGALAGMRHHSILIYFIFTRSVAPALFTREL